MSQLTAKRNCLVPAVKTSGLLDEFGQNFREKFFMGFDHVLFKGNPVGAFAALAVFIYNDGIAIAEVVKPSVF